MTLTQGNETLLALEKRAKALEEFKDLVARIRLSGSRQSEFELTQMLWLDFAEQQSRERSGVFAVPTPTIATQMYAIEMEALLRARIRELQETYEA